MIRAIVEIARDKLGNSDIISIMYKLHTKYEFPGGLKITDYHLCTDGKKPGKPEVIPCFGHNYKCTCENPEPYGVDRYFGIILEMPGAKASDLKLYTVNKDVIFKPHEPRSKNYILRNTIHEKVTIDLVGASGVNFTLEEAYLEELELGEEE